MYPTHTQIRDLFTLLHTDRSAFFSRVSPNVSWTIMGTHHLAGHFTSKDQVQKEAWNRLERTMKSPGIKTTVRNIIGGGDSPWCTVEMVGKGNGINGFNFENCYAWCCRFDENGVVVEVRSYLDSAMVRDAFTLLDRFGEEYEINKRAEVPDLSNKESGC